MKLRWQILVVDDEEVMCESLAAWLREDGYQVDTAGGGREAVAKAVEKDYAIYFVDLKMPGGMDGIETMMEIRRLHPEAAVIIMTAFATVDTAVAAMKEGAQEYIVKPCNPEEISLLVSRIIKVKNLERENLILRRRLYRQYRFQDILTKNPAMQAVLDLARDVANLKSTVLIRGESGTGKEMVARALHNAGVRAGGPFVPVACAALAESLLESELFGHEKGAFTGAAGLSKGKFEQAGNGTIFLDEIGEISSKVQVELLRVLQDHAFYRVGGSEEIRVDTRVVAATNRNLEEAVATGQFREDLFYRLNVIEIRIPPLRERREDIPLLARHFIEKHSPETGKPVVDISEEALEILLDHTWPGNVRELENAMERALVTCRKDVITEENLAFLNSAPRRQTWPVPPEMTLEALEEIAIKAALDRTGGNVKEAASQLGIDRSTLYEKIKRYQIPRG